MNLKDAAEASSAAAGTAFGEALVNAMYTKMSDAVTGTYNSAKNYAENYMETQSLMRRMGVTSKPIRKISDLKPGDHISYKTNYAALIYYHAIVFKVIDGKTVEVIQYSSLTSLAKIIRSKEDLAECANAGYLYRTDYEPEEECYKIFRADEVVKRAQSQIGKVGLEGNAFNMLYNNNEHLATWCKTGKAFSGQSGQQ